MINYRNKINKKLMKYKQKHLASKIQIKLNKLKTKKTKKRIYKI